MDELSLMAQARQHSLGNVHYYPETDAELRVHRMQHLMSLRGRPTKSDDPGIRKHVDQVKTTRSAGSNTNRWGERVNEVKKATG